MVTRFAVLRSAGATGRLCASAAGKIRTIKLAIDSEILRRRSEAILQALDKRALLDIGVRSREEDGTEREEFRDEPISLRAIFSWTRFAK